MISKALIKHIASLHHSKFRDLHGEFIAEGIKVVNELLQSQFRPRYLCALKQWLTDNEKIVMGLNAEVVEISSHELERISAMSNPNSVLAVFEKANHEEDISISENDLVLVLEDIRDPGNLGTMIRIADWFGIDQVICSKSSVDIYNPKTVQATMGSIARVNVHYHDIAEFIQSLPKNISIFATSPQGENIYNVNLPQGGIILIGNESKGLSNDVFTLAKLKLSIPAAAGRTRKTAGAESLNASVAAAIVCSEFRRRFYI